MNGWEGTEKSRSPQPRQAAAAIAGLVVIGVVVALSARGGETDPRDVLEVETDTEPSASAEPDAAEAVGAPGDAAEAAGDAHDVSDAGAVGEWTVVDAAPISGRTRAIAVWTGTHVLVWGGRHERWEADGAAYDPASDEWRPIPPAPAEATIQSKAVWTGTEMAVFGARGGAALAYDPDSGAWRALAEPPHRLQGAGSLAAVWTGSEVVVMGAEPSTAGHGFALRALAYDPSSDTWATLPRPGLEAFGVLPRLVLLDDRVVALARDASGDGEPRLAAAAYDPGAGRWTAPDPAPFAAGTSSWVVDLAVDETAGKAVVAGSVRGRSWSFHAAAWSPQTGWEPLPELPTHLHARPVVAAVPAGYLVWQDVGQGTSQPSGWLLSDGRWRPLTAHTSGARLGAAVVWTGQDLFVWGGGRGVEDRADGIRWRARDRTREYCCSP
jgi:hypothetical protein